MADQRDTVIVIDADGKFLDPTRPGQARRLLKSGGAEVHSRDPFAIRLDHVVHDPVYNRRPIVPNTSTPGRHVFNFTEYFKEEKDVYVQNISSSQISMQFTLPGGGVEPFLLPALKDPVNLTQYVPFAAIRDSADFRKMLNRQPRLMLLLTEDEYRAYFVRKAENYNMVGRDGKPSMEVAMQDAELRATAIRNKQPLPNAPEPMKVTEDPNTGGKLEQVQLDDILNPRVIHIIGQVSNPNIEEKDKPPAQEVLQELDNIPNLGAEDLEYILAGGYYKSVKNWARTRLNEMAQTE